MVNPTKYDDFLEHDRVVKQYHGVDVEFVQYKCPLEGCVDLVNVRADDIDKRKSTRCLAHLKICKAATAAQDPRVCGKRKAPEPTSEPEPSETRLTRREEELELRNDTLQQQNCSTRAELDDVPLRTPRPRPPCRPHRRHPPRLKIPARRATGSAINNTIDQQHDQQHDGSGGMSGGMGRVQTETEQKGWVGRDGTSANRKGGVCAEKLKSEKCLKCLSVCLLHFLQARSTGARTYARAQIPHGLVD